MTAIIDFLIGFAFGMAVCFMFPEVRNLPQIIKDKFNKKG